MISFFSTAIKFNTDMTYLAKVKRNPRQMNRIRQSEKNKTHENQPSKIKSQRKLIFPRQPNEKLQMTGDIKN